MLMLTSIQGGILFIQWSVYGLSGITDSGLGRDQESTKQIFDSLHVAEHELRRSGHHVLHDQSQGALWVFDLSGPSVRKEPKADYLGGVPALIGRHKLRSKQLCLLIHHSIYVAHRFRIVVRLPSSFRHDRYSLSQS